MEEGKSDQKIATEVVESNVLNKLDPLCSGDFSPSNPVTTTSHEPAEGSEIGSDKKISETSTEAPSSSTKLDKKNEIGVIDQNLVKIGVSEAHCSKSDLGNNEKVFKIDESDLDVNSILKPVPEEVQSSVIDPDSQDEDIVLKWDNDDECMADLTDTQLPAKEDSVKTNKPQDNEEVVSANTIKDPDNNEISSNAEEVSGNFVNTTKDPDYNEISNSADENNSSKEDVLSQIDSILEQDKNIVSGNDKISAICKKDTENMEVSDQSDENSPTELILAATELVEAEETLRKAQFKEANDNTDSTSLKLDDTCLDRPSSDEHHKADNIDGKNDEIDKKKEEISVDIDIITDKTQVKETIEDNNMDVDTEKVAVKTDNVVDAALDVSNSNYMETVANSTVIDSTKENNIENENLDTTAITSDTLSNSASLDPIDHGLKQPNFMIEIPTQELINLSDNSVESDLNISLGNTEKQEENTIEPSLKEETDNKDVKENIIEDLKERNSADIEVQKSSKNVDDREPDLKEELVDITLKEIKSPPCMMSSDDPQIEVDNEQELSKELEQNIQLDCKVSDTKESQVEIEKAQTDAQTVVKDVLHRECEPVEDKLTEIVEKPEIDLEKTDQKTEQDSVINQHKEINSSTVFSSTDTEQQKVPITINEIETIKEADCKIDSKSPSKPAEDSEIDIETFLKETRPLEPQIDDVPNEEIDDLLFEDDSPPDFNDDKDITMNASVLENIIEKLDSSIENKPVLKTDEVTDINISTEEATEIKNEAEQKQEIDQAAMETESELDKEKTTPTNLGNETISTETSITKEGIETSTDKSSKEVSSVLEAPISEEAEKDVPESSKTSVESSKTSCGEDVQPSTSQATSPLRMEAVSSEDVAEVTDSLGLLAEFRAHDDQDSSGQDDSDGDGDGSGDGDADGDYQDDESSNQMMIDQSEDSAQHSENDLARPSETETEDSTDQANKDLKATDKEFNFAITSVVAGKEALAVADDEEEVASNIVELEDVVEEAPVSELILEQLDVEVVAESTVSDAVEEPAVLQLESIDQLDVEVVAESTVRDAVEEPVVLQLETMKQAATEAKTSRVPTPSEADEASTDLGVVDLGEISSEDDAQEERKTKHKDGAADDTATSTKGTASSPTQIAETAAKEATPALTRVTEKEDKSKSEVVEQISLDSDEETMPSSEVPLVGRSRCVNSECRSGVLPLFRADSLARAHYHARRKNGRVCRPCLDAVLMRAQSLIADVKDFKPLLSLDMGSVGTDLVEISDSSSDSEGEEPADDAKIGILGAKLLEKELAGLLNDTWVKYRLDERMQEAEDELNEQIKQIEDESAAVDAMLSQCQQATDELRNELYAAFETPRRDLPALSIFDTPNNAFCSESPPQTYENKRRLDSAQESLAKRRAGDDKDDDKEEVSVVQLSGEAAPPSLPPAGEMRRPPIAVGMQVYAMRNAFGSWIKARVLDVTPKPPGAPQNTFSTCKVKFENKTRTTYKTLSARCLAYNEPSAVRMTIGTRLIALFKDSNSKGQRVAYYSGVVAEVPNPVNKYRYLVFFDDGYAQYVQHSDTRLVCESSSLVWEEVHPFSREFVKEYLLAYPERPMVRLHPGQNIKTEWNGKWWTCRVISVDASLVQVFFSEDKRIEWIYRGSTRLAPLYLELQAGRRQAANVPRRLTNKNNMPYVEYTRSEEAEPRPQTQQATRNEELRRQRAVAKKSTVCGVTPPAPAPPADNLDAVTSRVVYYTPKNAVRPHKMVPHTCSARCKRTDVLALKDLRTYNPLAKPLLSGWERQLVRYKGHKEVVYRAPCGRRLRNMKELHRYLRVTSSDMAVDLFDFSPLTHCLAEFVLNKCIVGKKDLSHSKENVPVPCVNYYDDSLPEFCSYNTERTPTAGVPLNLDPDFLCGCDCTDDCEDKSKCACWQMTLEGARTIGMGDDVGYVYKRLPEPLPSGIYECNSRCKCKQTCLNRVAQHPLQLKLQVFKTLNRGWGIRALNDVPKGSFLCIYAGNLLTDATANLDGLNEGDEYLAELDYIEVVEQMKEGYEEDVPEHDKKLDEKDSESESESEQSEEESPRGRTDEDGDFQPAFNMPVAEFSKRLRKREKKKQKDKEEEETKEKKDKEKDGNTEEDCITISDDEELREPARFAAQAGPGEVYAPKYRSVRSYFGKDEACYIMDAKVQGNIGRYLNHSCSPNVFVQNVFVDTHDPRFPWVAFFALAHIRAGTELTWNYNYDVGSVPGKALYCYCGSHNCRGRLL